MFGSSNPLDYQQDYEDFDIDASNLKITDDDDDDLNMEGQLPSIYSSQVNGTNFTSSKINDINYTSIVKDHTEGSRKNQTMEAQKVPIYIKALDRLMKISSVKEQHKQMISQLQRNRWTVVTVRDGQEDSYSELKMGHNNKKQKQEGSSHNFKIEEVEPWDIQNEVKIQEGVQRAVAEPTLMFFQAENMQHHFNKFGHSLYYQDVLIKDCDDVFLGQLCFKFRMKMGLLYSFSLEMKPVTLGVYCIYALTEQFDKQFTYYLMHAILDTVTRKDKKYFPNITFFTHGFQQAPVLDELCKSYKEAVQAECPWKKVPTFSFFNDPAYLNPYQLLSGLDVPRKSELEDCLYRIFSTISKKQFELAQSRLFLLITDQSVGNFPLESGHTFSEYIQATMQQAQYLCPSQASGVLGVTELYFKDRRQERKCVLNAIREELVVHCIDIYQETAKRISSNVMTQNSLMYLTLGVINRQTEVVIADHSRTVNNNYSKLNAVGYRQMELNHPELRFIKLETSKYIYEYLIQQLMEGLHWEVHNKYVAEGIKHFNLEIDPQDELYFIQYQQLPMKIYNSQLKFLGEYYWVRGSKRVKDVWQCECGFSAIYGLPCCHELKICVLTKYPIKRQLLESFTDEEYYDKYIDEPGKFEAKLEVLNSKKNYLQPLGTESGRKALLNHTVNKRKFSIGHMN